MILCERWENCACRRCERATCIFPILTYSFDSQRNQSLSNLRFFGSVEGGWERNFLLRAREQRANLRYDDVSILYVHDTYAKKEKHRYTLLDNWLGRCIPQAFSWFTIALGSFFQWGYDRCRQGGSCMMTIENSGDIGAYNYLPLIGVGSDEEEKGVLRSWRSSVRDVCNSYGRRFTNAQSVG